MANLDAIMDEVAEMAAKVDALSKRCDSVFGREDAQSEDERINNVRQAFGFVPGGNKTYTAEKRKPSEEHVPLGNGQTIARSKVNKVTKSLLGWK